MAPKRRFIPRTLAECRQALGDLEDVELQLAFEDGLREEASLPAGDTERKALFRLLEKPKPGDWLESKEELGQSFPQYIRRINPKSGAMPRPSCNGLLVCPVGLSFNSDVGKRMMPHLLRYYQAFFPGMDIEVLEQPLSLKGVQSRINDYGHKQYLIGDIFTMLNTRREVISKGRAFTRLGVTLEDIYPGEEWNYVFGQARLMERVGVFSFARHSPLFYEGVHATETGGKLSTREMLQWLRTCRHTMVHETCHMFGILHCVYWHCLMNGSNGPGDSNGSTAFLCPVCMRKVMYALSGVSGPPSLEATDSRYAEMQAVLQDLAKEVGGADQSPGLRRDLEWLELRRAQLQELRTCPPPPAPPKSARGASTK